jgi:hypothetical protein
MTSTSASQYLGRDIMGAIQSGIPTSTLPCRPGKGEMDRDHRKMPVTPSIFSPRLVDLVYVGAGGGDIESASYSPL